eukprot:SAG11_NODE_14956_length_593_cov_1.518219_1_plen_184_part_01
MVHQALFKRLIRSFRLVSPALDGGHLIVVCDGFRLAKAGQRQRLKAGLVSAEVAAGYADFLSWLECEVASGAAWLVPHRVELLRLESWRGWTLALQAGLAQVQTRAVMVVQDDRCFLRRFDRLAALAALVCAEHELGYVLLPTAKQKDYAHGMASLAGRRGVKLTPERRMLALPCTGWYAHLYP